MKINKFSRFDTPLALLNGLAIIACLYIVFMLVPNERLMGAVQRIFYFHVGSAIACYFAFGIVLICSLGYLATRKSSFDAFSHAACEVGFLFCSITLVTGMIWGHSAWNTWFRWEPRLVTFLLLWFIFFGINALRKFGDPSKIAAHVAVLSILGVANVPLVVYSVKFLPQSAQLHPVVVENGGLRDPMFKVGMFAGMCALIYLQFILVWLRARIELLHRKI